MHKDYRYNLSDKSDFCFMKSFLMHKEILWLQFRAFLTTGSFFYIQSGAAIFF